MLVIHSGMVRVVDCTVNYTLVQHLTEQDTSGGSQPTVISSEMASNSLR